ncbi:hypothetical protein AT279_02135 [Bacillus cereus]|nr:hypothetical protein BA201_14415 [Bacillus cereus]KXY94523.1 hypothetical protein AT279_02135 [Bacillus cereus]OJD45176.1 hypothetical protein BAU24_20575 [Bacillus sp. L27]
MRINGEVNQSNITLLETDGLKRCNVCKKYKMLDHFHKHRLRYDGLASACKPCLNIAANNLYSSQKLMARKSNARSVTPAKK